MTSLRCDEDTYSQLVADHASGDLDRLVRRVVESYERGLLELVEDHRTAATGSRSWGRGERR